MTFFKQTKKKSGGKVLEMHNSLPGEKPIPAAVSGIGKGTVIHKVLSTLKAHNRKQHTVCTGQNFCTVTLSKHPCRMKQDGFDKQLTLRQFKQADPSHLGRLYPVLGGEGCQPAHHSPCRRAEAGSESPPCPRKGHGLPRTESPIRPSTGMTGVQLRQG